MLNKLADGAATQAEAAAAEGAAKAKEEALAKAREAACSHECSHSLDRHHVRPHLIKAGSRLHNPLMAHGSRLLPVLCAVGSAVPPLPQERSEAQPSYSHRAHRAAALAPYTSLRPSYHTGEAALSAVGEAQRPLDEAQYSSSSSGSGVVVVVVVVV